MNWKTIFNPFEKFDEKLLLLIGILTVLLSIAVGYWTGTSFNSIYKIGNLDHVSLKIVALSTLASFIFAIIILFILGKILNNKTRFIDIINTVLISQLVLVILQCTEKISFIDDAKERMITYAQHPSDSIPLLDTSIMMGMALLSITLLTYSIVLFYNGFKTATNIKKWQHIALFAVVSLVSVIICQIIMSKFI
ncbi:YIP1 family protein [Chryseobacterium lactis]|uniref:YIP1 family protein n=1 Tax=Chryseobacterium lactis TaxID=1241981 RepID=UPI001628B6F6|nr:YIP1 family protein [Chryseobacterium lactis]